MLGLDQEFSYIKRGEWLPLEVVIDASPKKKEYATTTQKMIDAAWKQAQQNPDLKLTNNLIFSYLGYTTKGGSLIVKTQMTDFKSFYGTNVCNHATLPATELANALAVCTVVISKDNAILLGKRSSSVAESQQMWHVIGGTMDLNRHTYQSNAQSPYFSSRIAIDTSPYSHIMKELKEELGIAPRQVDHSICLGLGINLLIGKPELLYITRVKQTAKQLRNCTPHAILQGEHSELLTIAVEDIPQFVADNPVAPIGKAALYAAFAYLRDGDAWAKQSLNTQAERMQP